MKLKYPFHLSIFITCIIILFSVGCKKTEMIYNPATDKISETAKMYNTVLGSSANGWKLFIFPDLVKNPNFRGGFSFYMKFDTATQRVTMLSDLSDSLSTNAMESHYSMKFTSLNTLSFDTYSYLGVVADPLSSISGGPTLGTGNMTDVEYSFLGINATQDTIYLKGNLNGSKGIMVKASSADEAYLSGGKHYQNTINNFKDALHGHMGLHIELPNSGGYAFLNFSPDNRTIVVAKEITSDSIFIHKTGVVYSGENTIFLDSPIVLSGVSINSIKLENGQLVAVNNNGITEKIIDLGEPNISAYKMIASGGYSSFSLPMDVDIDQKDYPNAYNDALFLNSALLGDWNAVYLYFTNTIRIYTFNVTFKTSQKRMFFNIMIGVYNEKDYGELKSIPSDLPDEQYTKFTLPYQFRYTINADETMNYYYEGAQYVIADQLKGLSEAFKTAMGTGLYKLVYTKTSSNLYIAFQNIRTREILVEGIPY